MVSIVFIKIKFTIKITDRGNTFYINSSLYSSDLQRALVKEMNQNKHEDERIDWRVNEQDNTPMYQHFKGLSLYSSIFHHNILDYYYDALNNLAEVIGRYQSTNGRQNIASLFSVRYMMLKITKITYLPTSKKNQVDSMVFMKIHNLPSVKVTDSIYNSKN